MATHICCGEWPWFAPHFICSVVMKWHLWLIRLFWKQKWSRSKKRLRKTGKSLVHLQMYNLQPSIKLYAAVNMQYKCKLWWPCISKHLYLLYEDG